MAGLKGQKMETTTLCTLQVETNRVLTDKEKHAMGKALAETGPRACLEYLSGLGCDLCISDWWIPDDSNS